jgi:polyribonucleotide nucleotidyltransferase
MKEIEKSISFDGRDIRLNVGLLAPQAGGAVLIQSGDTAVFVTATRSQGREGIDFLPLLVDYEERLYAGGKIPGGFLRREGRPPEKVTLTSRLIDRPLRPLFPQWLRDDIQIVATTLSMDEQVPPDVLAVTGASVAVLMAELPFMAQWRQCAWAWWEMILLLIRPIKRFKKGISIWWLPGRPMG